MNEATEKMVRSDFIRAQTSFGDTIETRLGFTYVDETDHDRPKSVSVKTQEYEPTTAEIDALVRELKMLEAPRAHFERGSEDFRWRLKSKSSVG